MTKTMFRMVAFDRESGDCSSWLYGFEQADEAILHAKRFRGQGWVAGVWAEALGEWLEPMEPGEETS